MQWLDGTDPTLVREFWPTCDEVDPDRLVRLLASARIQCAAFAPATEDPEDVPVNYVQAQAEQARALHRSGVAGSGDQIGGDGLAVTVYPMDWTVKALLRPKRGLGAIA